MLKAGEKISEDIPVLFLDSDQKTLFGIIPLLALMNFIENESDFLRQSRQGELRLNGRRISGEGLDQALTPGDILAIGERGLLRVSL